jgi:6-phosphogluconate dehydrogenase
MKREIGLVGFGKMGGNMALHLLEHGWRVSGYARKPGVVRKFAHAGVRMTPSLSALIERLPAPRVFILMITAGKPVDDALFGKGGVIRKLEKGDIVIDSGNSFYKDSVRRGRKLAKRGIKYVDVGFSGGPLGARRGGCLMIGGDRTTFKHLEPLFKDLAKPDGYQFFEGMGAGHFAKMVHNGIEYGMMQSLAEGFAILKKSKYSFDLMRVADIYNNGSVIESRLVGWLENAFKRYGENLASVSGTVRHTGEGEWTAKTARELGVPAEIIERSFKFRVHSAKKPSFTGKIVSALRGQFGGHNVGKK